MLSSYSRRMHKDQRHWWRRVTPLHRLSTGAVGVVLKVRLPFLALLLALALTPGLSRAADSGSTELDQAYQALSAKDYDRAIAKFRMGLAKRPANPAAHKDLAYTLLKTGDNLEARDEFEAALKLNSHDETSALEYAFLCYETKKPIEARRTFERLRKYGVSATTKKTAEDAFQNIDIPLAEGIAQWKEALARSSNPNDPSTFSAHWELAQLAERRDDLNLAAEQYEICRQLKPQVDSLLLDEARVWQQLNRVDDAHAALIAASWSKDPRTAEQAKELFGARYPYVYEFQKALVLDSQNTALRRELAYLLLQLHRDEEATKEFAIVARADPGDRIAIAQLAALLAPRAGKQTAQLATSRPTSGASQVPSPTDQVTNPKSMAQKSLAAGYVKDAIRYYHQAIEHNPDDAEVAIGLGWAYNIAGDDREAIRWFDRARHMSNSAVAKDAERAYRNLSSSGVPEITIWGLPIYSTRWQDTFAYSQLKVRIPLLAHAPVQFYLSTRLIGDALSAMPASGSVPPKYLSESAVIFGGGAATRTWHHFMGWAEAGEAVSYLPQAPGVARAIPDYRGGINFAKGFGNLLNAKHSGLFYETTTDGVYVSRFDKDVILYNQHRAGRTFHLTENTSAQLLFNGNITVDLKDQYWANTLEVGPGIRLHAPFMPRNVYFLTDYLLGYYLRPNQYTPQSTYHDLRIGLWYAFSR
jgi:tetratricopeptide (TPR) repeat protein